MADENIERRMEYIAGQQEQFAARMGEIEDIIVRFARATRDRFEGTDGRLDDIDERISALVDSQLRTEERVNNIDERISALVDSQLRTQERIHDIDERISALVDSQLRTEENVKRTEENVKKTDEALRSLIAVVDRYLSESRNGNSKG